jgi:hypothetical protein
MVTDKAEEVTDWKSQLKKTVVTAKTVAEEEVDWGKLKKVEGEEQELAAPLEQVAPVQTATQDIEVPDMGPRSEYEMMERRRSSVQLEKRERLELERSVSVKKEKVEVVSEEADDSSKYQRPQKVVEEVVETDVNKLQIKKGQYQFTRQLSDVTTRERDNAIFECVVSHANVVVTWFVNSVEVVPGTKYQVIVEGLTHHWL